MMIRSRDTSGIDSNPIVLSEHIAQVYGIAFGNDDIIREIFSHLTTKNPDRYSSKSGLLEFFSISKRVYEQAQYVRSQWIQVNLISVKIFDKISSDSLMDIIVKYNMRHLNLREFRYNSIFFNELITRQPHIESLIIDRGTFGTDYPKMNSLKYFSMYYFSAKDLEGIVKSSPLLETLEHFYVNVNDSSMSLIAKYCLHLKSIELQGTYITDVGVKALVLGCTKLEVINLSWLKITDESLIAIANNCKELKSITLRCTKVTIVGIRELIEKCLKLEMVDLSDTSITRVEMEKLSKSQSNLTITTCSLNYILRKELM